MVNAGTRTQRAQDANAEQKIRQSQEPQHGVATEFLSWSRFPTVDAVEVFVDSGQYGKRHRRLLGEYSQHEAPRHGKLREVRGSPFRPRHPQKKPEREQ